MVATDVASRGIGMIKENSLFCPLLPACNCANMMLSSLLSTLAQSYSIFQSQVVVYWFSLENYFDLGVQLP